MASAGKAMVGSKDGASSAAAGGGEESAAGVNVKVILRCRPLNEREKTDGAASVVAVESERAEVSVTQVCWRSTVSIPPPLLHQKLACAVRSTA